MPKFPTMKAKDFYKYLIKYGCEPVSINGSHFKVCNPKNGEISSVPIHSGKDIGRYFATAILSQLGIDVEDFVEFMKNQ